MQRDAQMCVEGLRRWIVEGVRGGVRVRMDMRRPALLILSLLLKMRADRSTVAVLGLVLVDVGGSALRGG